MKKVLVLGCTGSIGQSALDVIRAFPSEFKVCALVAHKSGEKAKMLSEEFSCPYALTSEEENCICRLIQETKPDIAVNGIAGSSGLMPSVTVVEAGVDLALANKETVVMAWKLIKELADKKGSKIIPVDSEHSALFNLLERIGKENVSNLIITASGGPFREMRREELFSVTVDAALRHPTWKMGKKITVDSATLANKGLEVIEAVRLFGFSPDRVKVVVHPQSVVHSLVQTRDGMLYAQLSYPDMKHPILSALSWPRVFDVRKEEGAMCTDILGIYGGVPSDITFARPRLDDFAMLPLAYKAIEKGSSYPIAYNAANEAAAYAFIAGRIRFTEIASVARSVLDADWSAEARDFNDVLSINEKAHLMAEDAIKAR